MNEFYSLPEAIRVLRDRKGFTQSQLAELAGYESAVSISNLERGRTTPRITSLYKLAQALEVDIDVLVQAYKRGKRGI